MSKARRPGTFHLVSSLTARLRSALLCGLFLLGTLGVPLADGAMFHVAGQDPCAGVTHVEAQGGSHHADRCTLAQPAAAQRQGIGSAHTVGIPLPLASRIIARSAASPQSTAFINLQHSRAPPA